MLLCVASCLLVFAVSAGSAAARGNSPGGAAATADCSKTTATEIVLRLHLNDPEVSDPVGKVLCGSFTGPGSQTMVVSLWGPGNTGFIEFAVFRWDGGAWQYVMKQPAAASITAAGPDIRQTLPIYRPNDSRCCPTGGTKTRIWHWNGTRFTVSPWKATKGKGEPSRFDSPRHNIHCWMFDGSGSDYSRGVGCNSDKPRRMVNMNADGRLKILGRKAWCGCDEPDFPALGYGKHISVGRFRCLSQQGGVTCTVIQSGRGFFISRAGVRRVGP